MNEENQKYIHLLPEKMYVCKNESWFMSKLFKLFEFANGH